MCAIYGPAVRQIHTESQPSQQGALYDRLGMMSIKSIHRRKKPSKSKEFDKKNERAIEQFLTIMNAFHMYLLNDPYEYKMLCVFLHCNVSYDDF